VMGIGVGEILCLLVVAVVLLAGIVGFVLLMSRKQGGPSSGPRLGSDGVPAPHAFAPVSTDTLFFLRFGPDHEAMIHSQVQSLAPGGRLAQAADIRDAAMDLGRSVPDATHAWVGPAPGPTVDRPRSPERGGAIVALRAHTRTPLDTVADDADATAVAASLRTLMSLSDGDVRGGTLTVVSEGSDPDFPMMVPLRAATLPGQTLCTHCRRPYPQYETRCPHCGAGAAS